MESNTPPSDAPIVQGVPPLQGAGSATRHQALAGLLAYQRDMGVTSRIAPDGIDRFAPELVAAAASPATASLDANQSQTTLDPNAVPRKPTAMLLSTQSYVAKAQELAAQASDLAALQTAVQEFDGCALKETALHTVFADGNPNAEVMFVGEAPGADEDRQGKPFVGVSGQLLDTMLGYIGLTRDDNLYITNTVFWRPPGNRKPNPGEVGTCLPFTKRHIELVRPKVLVMVGGLAGQSLLDKSLKITRARGKWFDYALADGTMVPTLPILHPAYLLRTPISKRETWADLLTLRAKLAELTEFG